MKQKLLLLGSLLFLFAGNAQTTSIDCNAGPLIVNYCYGDNDTNSFTYVSSDGSPLSIAIISGNVEYGFDFLVITDTDGGSLSGDFSGNNGDISGFSFQSTGNSITFSINSNASISCASDSAGLTDEISYMVFCGDCNFNIYLGPDLDNVCEEDAPVILNAESPYVDFYEWYRNGYVMEGENGPTLTVTESGNYSVLGFNDNCQNIDEVNVTFVNCGTTGFIYVNAFYDTNTNSIFDAGEDNFSNGYFTYEMNDDGITHTVNSSTGQFYLLVENELDNYDIAFNFYDDNQSCYSNATGSFENITVSAGNNVSVEFPVVVLDSCEDLGVYLSNTTISPRPGFYYSNRIMLQNLGNESITSGTVEFMYDDFVQFNEVNSINPNYSVTTIPGGISIDFVNLMPNDVEDIYLSLFCPSTVPLGTVVTNTLTYTTADSDSDASNNSSFLSQIVIGSYDPNDIIESHGPEIVYDDFVSSDEYLYYVIRFQNIGTAEAINIRIENVLDSRLDESTFQMLRSSHDYVATRTNNEVIWQFDDINLPSESMEADASQGFVYYKIKPKAGYAIGDMIPNVADIYFDFNPPITTNTFITEFVETLSIDENGTSSFSIFPNPANHVVNVQINGSFTGIFNVEVFDIQGKQVLSKASSGESFIQLNVNSLESGLYFIKMKNDTTEMIKKLIIN